MTTQIPSGNVLRMDAANDTFGGTIYLKGLVWTGATKTTGDELIVGDVKGNEIWGAVMGPDSQSIVFNTPLPVIDLTVLQIDSGVLYVYKE